MILNICQNSYFLRVNWSVSLYHNYSLSGISPFHKESAHEMFLKVREGKWHFEPEAFADISNEAKDFISKLLEKDPKWVGLYGLLCTLCMDFLHAFLVNTSFG